MLYKAECSSKSSKRINWIHVCVVGKGSSYSILFHEPKSSLQKKNWVKVRGNSRIFIKPPNSTSLSNAWGCFLFTHLDFIHIDKDVQSNLVISNSVNSKSPLFRRKIECPWIYPSPLRFPGYFEAPLFRTFFHFPWDFEIAGFDCINELHVVNLTFLFCIFL